MRKRLRVTLPLPHYVPDIGQDTPGYLLLILTKMGVTLLSPYGKERNKWLRG